MKIRLLFIGVLASLLLGGCAAGVRENITPEEPPRTNELYSRWTLGEAPPDLFARNFLGNYRKPYNGIYREEDMTSAPMRPDPLPLQSESLTIPVTIDYSEEELQFGYTIPVVINDRVNQYINFYANRYKRGLENQLQRANYYLPMIREIFHEEGVPEDLAYVALIESGFRPTARSHAGAVGIWQFMPRTGQYYGLDVNWWIDERRDPIKSTRAAARYLNDLYNIFDDWYLALAGYNAGQNRVLREMNRLGVDSFWEIHTLPRETREYVPAILAAIIIANNQERYDINVTQDDDYYQPDLVAISHPTSLNVISNITGIPIDRIKTLNPELNGYVTPPSNNYHLKLYPGYGTPVETALKEMPRAQRVSWIKHEVRPGESLSVIANRYNISISEIRRVNQIRGDLLRVNQVVLIPSLQHPAAQGSNLEVAGVVQHRVRSGESLSVLSSRFSVPMSEIRRVNNLSGDLLRVGQTLLIPMGESAESARASLGSTGATTSGAVEHRVRSGENLSTIASRYNTSVSQIRQHNSLNGDIIRPGQVLSIPMQQTASTQRTTIRHEVRSGESLSVLADRYNVRMATIRRANNLNGDLLRVGQTLNIPVQTSTAASDSGQNIAGGIQHRVRSGESLSVIAERYQVSMAQIRQANQLSGNLIRVGQVLFIPAGQTAQASTYRVRSGDSLSVIAQNTGTSVSELIRRNNLPSSGIIQPGQVLQIP
ncbi:LysM peptidoglycan-binding domain-containing protein [Desulfurispira natronophila]|uniref:Membrane-bound lytic murein transglycosylase D n=1 Tax=Desulfurispira natronophila TaxID=682562 RepID=A0A7W7Y4H9_9BACT|nr:LysM peptidoglycan-binding domain-containing protein [Desulfurispira natronophila]MBB5021774.1 membrane-bound lytic murein transglycosylase D [Desulfurispira natronophila]